MNIQFNSEGFMVVPKEYAAALQQSVKTNNFHEAESKFIENLLAFGRTLFEELLEEQAPVKKKRQEICDLIRRHYAKQ